MFPVLYHRLTPSAACHLEGEHETALHDSRRSVHRHCKAWTVLRGCDGVVSFRTHAQRTVRPGVPPVADAGHYHVRLPVGVGEGSHPPESRNAIEFRHLRNYACLCSLFICSCTKVWKVSGVGNFLPATISRAELKKTTTAGSW